MMICGYDMRLVGDITNQQFISRHLLRHTNFGMTWDSQNLEGLAQHKVGASILNK